MEILIFFLFLGSLFLLFVLVALFSRITALANHLDRLKRNQDAFTREIAELRAALDRQAASADDTSSSNEQPREQDSLPKPTSLQAFAERRASEAQLANPATATPPEQVSPPPEQAPPHASPQSAQAPPPEQAPSQASSQSTQAPDIPAPAISTQTQARAEEKPGFNFERQLGAQLPVWVGGIALALAGFYLVKYSIENNLLSPVVRVILGGLLGIGLLFAAEFVRRKPGFANGLRIAQSLSGSGIAVCYATLFAAANLYQLIPNLVCFLGMAAVTALAVVLSLKHGPPIALLGLLGGFLTPMLVSSSDPSAPPLFIYLFLVFSGVMTVIRRQAWWHLSIPALLGAFSWTIFWMSLHFTSADGLWLGLFLVGVCATIVITTKPVEGEAVPHVSSLLNYTGLGGAILLMGVITGQAGFGFVEWALFALLALGGTTLAFFNLKDYGFLPRLSLAINLAMLLAWRAPEPWMFALTLLVFAVIHGLVGYVLMWRTRRPLYWTGLAGTASVAYFLLAYFKLDGSEGLTHFPFFWGFTALMLAVIPGFLLLRARTKLADHPQLEKVLGSLAISATTLLSLALTIEVDRDFLPVALTLQMLATSWLQTRLPIKAWRGICVVLAAVFGLLMIPQLGEFYSTMYGISLSHKNLLNHLPIVAWPSFHLGIPVVAFLVSSYLLRQTSDTLLVRGFEMAGTACLAFMGYFLIRHGFHDDKQVILAIASLLERGVTSNMLFVMGLACFYVCRTYGRKAFEYCGLLLGGLAIFRIGYFDLLILNPLLAEQPVQGWLVLNSLMLPFGLPILWSWLLGKALRGIQQEQGLRLTYGIMLLLTFVLVSLNVRFFFHHPLLNASNTSNAEVYSYSVVWLLLGVGLLLGGVRVRDKMLRYASLLVMILTVGKVFLYDASQLEGLYRVFSFFGLGLSLLGLSWFYTRFVFADNAEE